MLNCDKNQTPAVLGYEVMQHVGTTCMWLDIRNLEKDPKGHS